MKSNPDNDIMLVAFYLPQFHPIPENDRWWGKGFTEWTNVTKSMPLFDGHYQPHLPADLGFYDLRVRETRREQAELAKSFGIHGFCYHYYWFSGKRVLNRPFDEMIADPEADMPFCLCWANENWTRRWDGKEQEVLLKQEYGSGDASLFIHDLIKYFKDPKYIRIDGSPVLIVYAPQQIPSVNDVVSVWRQVCKENGIDKIHLVAALTHGNNKYKEFGFDAGVEFPPHNVRADKINLDIEFCGPFSGYALLYHEVAQSYLNHNYDNDNNIYRTVFPSWDNTARTGLRAGIVLNGTPGNYEYWLSEAVRKTGEDFPGKSRLVFINAWNEWAEGCHLEPDQLHGRAFLEATRRVRSGQSHLSGFTHTRLDSVGPGKGTFADDLRSLLLKHYYIFIEKMKIKFKQNPTVVRILTKIRS